MEIRRASAKDAAKISELEAEIFSDPWSERSVADTIAHEVYEHVGHSDHPQQVVLEYIVNEQATERNLRLLALGSLTA